VQRIEQAAVERQEAYIAARHEVNEEADPMELALIHRQTRQELEEVLEPEALEEYLLRFSPEAQQLRQKLRDFEPSPDEFRALFHALDPLDHQLAQLGSDNDPVIASRRRTLEQEKEQLVQRVLGSDRMEQYQLSQDPLYQQARDIARRAGAPGEQILPLTAIQGLWDMESRRIRSDASLSAEDRAEQLEAARAAHENSLRALLGAEAYRQYTQPQAP
jgi:hypothetical protein